MTQAKKPTQTHELMKCISIMKNEIFNHADLPLKNELKRIVFFFSVCWKLSMIETESETEKAGKRQTCNLFTLFFLENTKHHSVRSQGNHDKAATEKKAANQPKKSEMMNKILAFI